MSTHTYVYLHIYEYTYMKREHGPWLLRFYTPTKYWPRELQRSLLANRTLFAMLRDWKGGGSPRVDFSGGPIGSWERPGNDGKIMGIVKENSQWE